MVGVIDKKQTKDINLFRKAKRFIPGGVNSPVRAFKAVGGSPIFVRQGRGSKIFTEDGKRLIDYCLSWGALILGHTRPEVVQALQRTVRNGTSFGTATEQEIELAEIITKAIPSIEQIRLTNSGTEAVMGALRLARAYTGKDKIIKFEGSYHGHADYLLVKSGSGQATLGIPNSAGVPKDFIKHTIVLPYNNVDRIRETVRKVGDIAAIIIEPVAANCGVILPKAEFIKGIKSIADEYKIVLIFDEVITGFRILFGGIQNHFGIKPDLTCLGKVIGGGLPIGAFGGKREIMKLLAPEGPVYQAGTLSGNPLSVKAGIITLKLLKKISPYSELKRKTEILARHLEEKSRGLGIPLSINRIGSIFGIFFADSRVTDYETSCKQDLGLFKKFYRSLLRGGVYLSPSGFEANFLSTAHTERDIDNTLQAFDKALQNLRRK